MDHELLSSFKEAIIIAINHPNSDLKSLTQSIFEVKDCLDSNAKCILDEIEETIEKSHPKSDSVTKKKAETEQTKEIHIAGSFLNKKSANTKSVSSKPVEKNDKKTLILSEPDSQVNNICYFMHIHYFYIFVYILKFICRIMCT